MSTEPIRVAILGSCISRDVFNTQFNAGYKEMWQCVLIQNQSSLLSVMSPAVPVEEKLLGDHLSDFQKQQVRNDTSKEFLDQLRELRPDYLLVDFFGDVHFGVLEIAPGHYLTNNRWMLQKTHWYADRLAADDLRPLRIEEETDAYLALWEDALHRLQDFLRVHLPETTVVVHRGRNAERWLPEGASRPRPLAGRRTLFKIDVERANQLWRRLDDIAAAMDGWESIDLTDCEYVAFQGHPWGVFYVHYTLDYYEEFLAALNALHLSRTLGTGTVAAAMAAQIGEARRNRHAEFGRQAEQVRQLQQKVSRLRSRVGEAAQPRRRRAGWLRRG